MTKGHCHTEGAKSHAERTADKQRFAPQFLNREHCHQRERDINDTHEYRQNHRIVHAHVTKDTRCVIEHSIDTYSLLEHAEHDTHKDTKCTIGHQFLGLHHHRVLDILQDLGSLGRTVDLREDTQRLLILANAHKVTRCLRNETDQQGKKSSGYSLTTEHIAPTCGHCPLCSRIDGCQSLTHLLNERLDMIAQDEEVNEIDHQLTKDNGKLVPTDKHTTDIGRRHLTDIHRTDSRGKSHANTTNHPIYIKGDKQRIGRNTVFKKEELRIHRAKGRNEKENSRNNQRLLAPEVRGQIAR